MQLPLSTVILFALAYALHGADSGERVRPSIDVPRLSKAPLVTADILDPAWSTTALIPALGLSHKEPAQHLPTQSTTVQLGWEPDFLHIRFVCQDAHIFLPQQGRDAELYRGDVVEVFLDTVGDGAAVTELQFSPAGDAFDQVILLTRPLVSQENGLMAGDLASRDLWMDRSWNMEGLRWATKRSDSGWVTDVAIPARSALRRSGLGSWKPMTISANLLRYDYMPTATGQQLVALNWSTVQFGCPHLSPSRMGRLHLVE
jgi:hypothetical protein